MGKKLNFNQYKKKKAYQRNLTTKHKKPLASDLCSLPEGECQVSLLKPILGHKTDTKPTPRRTQTVSQLAERLSGWPEAGRNQPTMLEPPPGVQTLP